MSNARLAFDIETDGLVATKVHCLVTKDVDTGSVETFTNEQMEDGIAKLTAAAELIGHNIISYDIPSLKRIYPHFEPQGLVTDTLVLSRLIRADLKNEDFEHQWANTETVLPKRLYGSHSLGAWGYRIGLHKGDYAGGWETFSQEMLDYCIQDVEVTDALYKHLNPANYSQEAISYAHQLATVCDRVGNFGWTFDTEKAHKLYAELAAVREELEGQLHELFEPWDIEEEFIPKRNNKTKGYVAGEPFMKVKTIEFNPNSRRHIEFCLRRKYGWQPKLMTAQGHAQIDEAVLGELDFPEAQKLAHFFMIQKRIGQLAEGQQAWLKLQREGKIYHSIIAPSTVTGRATHRNCNLSQVPAVRLPYGQQCRELFTVQPGYVLLGADLASLELRCLAHYLNIDDYTREVLEGDIHSINMRAAGLDDRNDAKRFIFGWLYGAGPAKLGEIVGGGFNEGKMLLTRFNSRMPRLMAFRKLVEEKAMQRGYLLGLDGRQIKIRGQHKALNSLLQGAGASVSGQWLIETQRTLDEAGIDHGIMAWVHDEIQMQVREKDIEDVSNIIRRSAQAAGEHWQFRVPIDAECIVGQTWADSH